MIVLNPKQNPARRPGIVTIVKYGDNISDRRSVVESKL
jgi:hypothetical protein